MKKIQFYTLAAFGFLSISCEKDKETITDVTPEIAKITMIETDAQTSADIVGITHAEGFEGLQNFFNLIGDTDPFGGRVDVSHQEYRGFIKKQTRVFRQIFSPKKSLTGREEGDFNFEESKGIYNWNFTTEEFEKTGQSTIVALNFPTEGSKTLNASLHITKYAEVLIVDEFGGYYQPTRLTADLTIDEVLVIDTDATVAYNEYGDPISGDISLELVPYTFSLIFDDTASASSTLAASISDAGKTVVGVDLAITFDSADKEEISSISGNVTYGDLKVKGDLTITASEDGDLNDFVNLAVYENDDKLGDIVFIEKADDFGDLYSAPFIQYRDGTTERLEDIFEETVIEIEDFLSDLDEWG